MFLQQGNQRGEIVGGDFIVGIQKSDIVALCGQKSAISGRTDAAVGAGDQRDPAVLPGKMLHLLQRGIGGAVVAENQLKVRIILRQDRTNQGRKKRPCIVDGNNETDHPHSRPNSFLIFVVEISGVRGR